MTTIDDLLKAVEASIRSLDYTMGVADKVPPGTRVNVIRSQLELAREIVLKARGYAAAKSGTYSAAELQGVKEPTK